MARNGRPYAGEQAARRRRFTGLVVDGRRFDEAAAEVGMKPLTALRIVSEPGFHGLVVRLREERAA